MAHDRPVFNAGIDVNGHAFAAIALVVAAIASLAACGTATFMTPAALSRVAPVEGRDATEPYEHA